MIGVVPGREEMERTGSRDCIATACRSREECGNKVRRQGAGATDWTEGMLGSLPLECTYAGLEDRKPAGILRFRGAVLLMLYHCSASAQDGHVQGR